MPSANREQRPTEAARATWVKLYINILEHTGRLAETNEREQFEAGKMSEALQKMFQSMHPCVRLLIFFLLSLTMRLPRSCMQINPPYGEIGDEYMRLDYRLTITKGWKYVMTWKDFSIN